MTTRIHFNWLPLLLVAGSLAALVWSAFGTPLQLIIYNGSDSVPMGWYRITLTGSPAVGDIVLTRLPLAAATLAAQRSYLPTRIPLLKTVFAIAPQRVCVRGNHVLLDDQVVGKLLAHDRLGRPIPTWRGCRPLVGDELFLLSDNNPESFDSRYFGPISAATVIGRAQPLWLETRP
ncbi:S26 family signal peptidase [Pseudomonas sp. Ma2-10]